MNNYFNWKNLSKYRQELYGFSILSIVIFHYFETLLDTGVQGIAYYIAKLYVYILGSVGVDIFLFLSGVGIFQSIKRIYPNILEFYHRRARKILIPYFIIGTIFWMVKDILIRNTMIDFIPDLFLLSFWTRGIRTLWYVAFIIILYIISPILYVILKYEKKIAKLLFLASIIMVCILYFLTPSFFVNCEIALLRVPIYIFGFISSEKIVSDSKINKKEILYIFFFVPIYIICFIFDLPFTRLGDGVLSIFLALSIASFLDYISNYRINKIFAFFGGISYELYLVHVTGRNVLNTLNLGMEKIVKYFIFITLCITLSVFVHYLVGTGFHNLKLKK